MSLFIAGKINHVWFLIENIRSMNKRGKFKALVAMPGSDNKTLFEGVSMSPMLANCIAKDGTITLNFGSKACPELTVDQDGTIHGLTSSNHAPAEFKIPSWYILSISSNGEIATFDTYVPQAIVAPEPEQKPKRPTLTLVKT